MKEFIDYKESVCNTGNLFRLKRVMKKAAAGEEVTIGFLGGSITQGSLSTSPHNCYAWRVFEWWKENFRCADLKYINGGIGGTTSHFGAARVDADILSSNPDLVFVEFSVNDDDNEHFLETYEGLVRHIIKNENAPAVVLISNVFYDTGLNAEPQHIKVAKHYDLPLISMQKAIYPAVRDKKIAVRDITPDDLHPNDIGHDLVASVVNNFLSDVLHEILIDETPYFQDKFPNPITDNTYENAVRLDNRNFTPFCNGFTADSSKQKDITDCFKNGWLCSTGAGHISFEAECSGIAIQYRRYVEHSAPKAKVYIDGVSMVTLDANFDETWGDKLELTTVMEHSVLREHKIEVAVEDCNGIKNPFNLVSVILAR